jgi:hypothetical protein
MSEFTIPLVIVLGLVVLAVLAREAFVRYALRTWGRNARGRVTACRELWDDGNLYYVVSYVVELPAPTGSQLARTWEQRSKRELAPGDVVAVRYWSRNPRVNRIVGRVQ